MIYGFVSQNSGVGISLSKKKKKKNWMKWTKGGWVNSSDAIFLPNLPKISTDQFWRKLNDKLTLVRFFEVGVILEGFRNYFHFSEFLLIISTTGTNLYLSNYIKTLCSSVQKLGGLVMDHHDPRHQIINLGFNIRTTCEKKMKWAAYVVKMYYMIRRPISHDSLNRDRLKELEGQSILNHYK